MRWFCFRWVALYATQFLKEARPAVMAAKKDRDAVTDGGADITWNFNKVEQIQLLFKSRECCTSFVYSAATALHDAHHSAWRQDVFGCE